MLGERLDRAEWRHACQLAGPGFDERLVDQLVARGLLTEGARSYTFAAASVRSMILGNLSPEDRRARHLAVAGAVTDDERRGAHLLQGGAPAEALEPLRLALADARHAPARAARLRALLHAAEAQASDPGG